VSKQSLNRQIRQKRQIQTLGWFRKNPEKILAGLAALAVNPTVRLSVVAAATSD
jgi:hypothetical protein